MKQQQKKTDFEELRREKEDSGQDNIKAMAQKKKGTLEL